MALFVWPFLVQSCEMNKTEESDVDIAYEGEANLLLRSRMKQELESLFGCRVDIIRLRKQLVDSVFGQNVENDLIYV